jgi:acetylxylan esterase
MVKWTLAKYNGNPNRVFATGTSSGAMMTNVLLGSYPNIFAAGAAFAGVAFGCFAGPGYDVWNSACAQGQVIKTGAEWKSIVLAAYPGYNGYRPKMQVFHDAADTTLYPQNLQEEIKEWTAVLGLPSSPIQTIQNTPLSGWTKYIYGSTFEAYSAAGVPHNIPTQENVVMAWFDLTCTSGNCFSRTGGGSGGGGGGTPTITTAPATTLKTVTTSQTATTTAASGGGTVPKWGQWYLFYCGVREDIG